MTDRLPERLRAELESRAAAVATDPHLADRARRQAARHRTRTVGLVAAAGLLIALVAVTGAVLGQHASPTATAQRPSVTHQPASANPCDGTRVALVQGTDQHVLTTFGARQPANRPVVRLDTSLPATLVVDGPCAYGYSVSAARADVLAAVGYLGVRSEHARAMRPGSLLLHPGSTRVTVLHPTCLGESRMCRSGLGFETFRVVVVHGDCDGTSAVIVQDDRDHSLLDLPLDHRPRTTIGLVADSPARLQVTGPCAAGLSVVANRPAVVDTAEHGTFQLGTVQSLVGGPLLLHSGTTSVRVVSGACWPRPTPDCLGPVAVGSPTRVVITPH